MNRVVILAFFLFFSTAHLAAQSLSEKSFDHYTTARGLSNNMVSGIAQDSTGYIWIATSSGLNRFDGSRFVQFHSNSDSNSLTAELINGMACLDKNRLGVFASGLHIIDTKTGLTRNLFIPYHNPQYQYKFNMIVRAMGDDAGNVYVLSRSGFYHFDSAYKLVSRFDFYSEEDVAVTHFFFGRELYILDTDRLLIASVDGLYIYNKVTKKVSKMTARDCPPLADYLDYPNVFYSFFQIKPGEFIIQRLQSNTIEYVNIAKKKKTISTLPFTPQLEDIHYRSKLVIVNDTLFYITGHTSGFYKLNFNPRSGELKVRRDSSFLSHLCNVMILDRDRNLWVGTNKGLFRQNDQKAKVQSVVLPTEFENAFPNLSFDDIYVSQNEIFAGARGDAGLLIFDKRTLTLKDQVLFKNYDIRTNNIRGIVPINSSNLLLGTHRPLLLYDYVSRKDKKLEPPEWTAGDWASDLYKDKKGNIWIGARMIYRYNPVDQSFVTIPIHQRLHTVPSIITEDTAGNIWMAGHGLARYNTKLNAFDLLLDSFPYIKMPDKQVNAMVIDHNNIVWFNSNNNGLAAYDIQKRSFLHFTRSNGLPDDNIASFILTGNKMWIACFSGIACMDLRTLQIVSFGKEDGFPDMPVLRGARFFYDRASDYLYLGLSNSIIRFHPHEVLNKKNSPHLFIENVVVNGKQNIFLPGQNINTKWNRNELTVTIGSINFSDGSHQRFAYRILKDVLTPWISLGSQPSFSISGLSPGTHRIQVKVYSPDNRWPEQIREFNLVVEPPLWGETWFIVVGGMVALVLIWLLIIWRTNIARRKEMEKTQVEKLKADDYKNRLELEQISNYFSSSLAGKKTEDDVLWDVAQNLIGQMNYEDCIIYRWNEHGTRMIQKAAYGPKGKPGVITKDAFEVTPGQGIVGYVIQTGHPVLVHDTRLDPRYRVDDMFRLSEIAVPIIHNGVLLGVIDSEHHLPNYFSERDLKILTTIATLIGNKLKQIESEQSLDAKRRELAGINEQLAEARLTALQAQMNPHFVFNALNSIKRMILDADNVKASRYLSKFALMIRMTLNHSKEIFVTLDENIAYLEAYLEMEQLRFDDSFSYTILVDENLDVTETLVPSMMIQPLVENAIWHGLMQSTSGKKIQIGFAQHNNSIVCSVEDNGIGIRRAEKLKEQNKSPHVSVGLENLRKRIRVLNDKYNMGFRLTITDLNETDPNSHGTNVTLQFDLVNAVPEGEKTLQ